MARKRSPGFEVPLGESPSSVLFAERLRDGRVALGTRALGAGGEWQPGELHLLGPAALLDLVAWLSPVVEEGWIDTVRDRQEEQVRTAFELYGEGPGAVERLVGEILREIPPALLLRGMILLLNSIGPAARERLVARLNATGSTAEDSALRRRLAEENGAFAYVVAAAALFDALDGRGE